MTIAPGPKSLADFEEQARHTDKNCSGFREVAQDGEGGYSVRFNDDRELHFSAFSRFAAWLLAQDFRPQPSSLGDVHEESTEAKALRAMVFKEEWRHTAPMDVEPWYGYWVSELTAQGLHAKSDISTVLAILSKRLADSARSATALPMKPTLDWYRSVAEHCPDMDGTEDMVGVVSAVHRAMLTAMARYPQSAAPEEREWKPTHRHADGGLYRFVANTKYRSAGVWDDAILYEAKDGEFYVTSPRRWADRFSPLSPQRAKNDG